MNIVATHFGELMALLAALNWAVAVILFKKSGETVHPIALNVFKNVVAFALFIPTLWIANGAVFHQASARDFVLLLLSGAMGIGIADTLFFQSLNILGAGRSAVVACTYSPSVIICSMVWLDESMRAGQLLGVAMIISAVVTVTRDGEPHATKRGSILWGVVLGVLSQAISAFGIVLFKPILHHSPLLWVTEVRLVGGLIVLAAVLFVHRSRGQILQSVLSPERRWYTISATVVGTYVSMMFWLAGMKYTLASVAAALNQTNSVFIFLLAALLLRERITPIRALGIVLGVSGALLVTFA